MNHILEIVGMTFGVLGSAHIWKYFTVRLKAKNEEKKFDRNNDPSTLYQNELLTRVNKLEKLLQDAEEDKEKMQEQILSLTGEVKALRVEVDFLRKDNERLKNK